MAQVFELRRGGIVFYEDKIAINDEVRKERRWQIISSSLLTINGIFSISSYLTSGGLFLLWCGIIIFPSSLYSIVITYFRSTREEIEKAEIKSVKVKKYWYVNCIDIRLKNNQLRRVGGVMDPAQ